MEVNGLKVHNIEHCLKTLKEFRKNKHLDSFWVGLRLGYLEACLQSYNALETFKNKEGNNEVVKEIVKSDKWWKKDKKETYEEAIVRMAQKLILTLKEEIV